MKKGLVTLVALLAIVLLASCGGSDSADEEAGGTGGGDRSGAGAESAEPERSLEDNALAVEDASGNAESGAAEAEPAVLLDPSTREIVYTVDMTVEVDDVAAAVRQAATMAASAGGFVASETTEGDNASLTLRVPTQTHTDIVTRLEDLGEVRNRFRSAEDVTEQVVDVEARIASQRRSIERIRALLDQAVNIQDVVRIESELATREAELGSLLRRQEDLAKLTALARSQSRSWPPEAPTTTRMWGLLPVFLVAGMPWSTRRGLPWQLSAPCCRSRSWPPQWVCRRGG